MSPSKAPQVSAKGPLEIAHALVDMGVPVFTARLDKDGNPFPPKGWENIKPDHRRVDGWRRGLALCAVTGVRYDVIDVDPRNGGTASFAKLSKELGDNGPEVYWQVRTASGGVHQYIETLDIGSRPGFLKGIDLKGGKPDGSSRGFVFLPGTKRPDKSGAAAGLRPYVPQTTLVARNGHHTIAGLRDYITSLPSVSAPGVVSGRRTTGELRQGALNAVSGTQRSAFLAYVLELQRKGYDREDIVELAMGLVAEMPVYDERRPWRESHIRQMFKEGVIGDAAPGEMGRPVLRRSAPSSDEEFWTSRPGLAALREWARARQAGPYGVLAEVIAGVVCRTYPALVLPPITGGFASLNLLIALTGASGAGKGVATATARQAVRYVGAISPDRVPIGSGEGLAKTFGYVRKDPETGFPELVRTTYAAIIEIPEIDSLKQQLARSGATLSPQLRQLYSGEGLGYGYADTSKRVLIPPGEYRACLLAGVQPGRGEVILGDSESGFAQRWLWLPVTDPYAIPPEQLPGDPKAVRVQLPRDVLALEPDSEPIVMDVCGTAVAEVRAARYAGLRGETDVLGSHALQTRLKVAAAFGLLDGRAGVEEADWELARHLMGVSDATRELARERLVVVADEEARQQGRTEGVRSAAREESVAVARSSRIADNVLSNLSDSWTSYSKLSRKIAPRDRAGLKAVLDSLVKAERIEAQETEYHGQPGMAYRRAR